jgi:hypothetical protein
MQGGQRETGNVLEERKVQQIGVEMQHIEVVGVLAHLVQQRQMGGDVGFQRGRVEPDRLVAHGHKTRAGPRIGAAEQGDLMAQVDQRVGKVGHDALRAAIQPRRYRFAQRADLGDSHETLLRTAWVGATAALGPNTGKTICGGGSGCRSV